MNKTDKESSTNDNTEGVIHQSPGLLLQPWVNMNKQKRYTLKGYYKRV